MLCLKRLWGYYLLLLVNVSYAFEPVKLQVSSQYDGERSFSGIEGFNFTRLNSQVSLPLVYRTSPNGRLFIGTSLTENRFFITGDNATTRRLYRFSFPFQFFAQRVGRWQHSWLVEPALYSDESIVKQKRSSVEYGWQASYFKTEKARFVMGIQRDNRFGVDAYYPVFGLESKPNHRWHHHWVFPDIYSKVQFSYQSALKVFLQPQGGGWRYEQADGSVASLSMHFWQMGVNLSRQLKPKIKLDLSVGMNLTSSSSIAGFEGDISSGYFINVQLQKMFLRR